jgi:hypothetical protein
MSYGAMAASEPDREDYYLGGRQDRRHIIFMDREELLDQSARILLDLRDVVLSL